MRSKRKGSWARGVSSPGQSWEGSGDGVGEAGTGRPEFPSAAGFSPTPPGSCCRGPSPLTAETLGSRGRGLHSLLWQSCIRCSSSAWSLCEQRPEGWS